MFAFVVDGRGMSPHCMQPSLISLGRIIKVSSNESPQTSSSSRLASRNANRTACRD